jgi:hypothetical protein
VISVATRTESPYKRVPFTTVIARQVITVAMRTDFGHETVRFPTVIATVRAP